MTWSWNYVIMHSSDSTVGVLSFLVCFQRFTEKKAVYIKSLMLHCLYFSWLLLSVSICFYELLCKIIRHAIKYRYK